MSIPDRGLENMFDVVAKSGDRWLVAVLCLLAAGALSPSAVLASCGDYVVLGANHGPHGDVHHHSALSDDRMMAEKGSFLEVEFLEVELLDGSPDRVPCSGPECSRHRGPLPAAPVDTQVVIHERCIKQVLADTFPPHVSFACPGGTAVRPIRSASHIFHPPRFLQGWLAA